MNNSLKKAWNEEYNSGDIASTSCVKPSISLQWGLNNLSFIGVTVTSGMNALDIGCGTGRNSLYLSTLGYKTVGFDVSDIAIQKAISSSRDYPENTPQFFTQTIQEKLPTKDNSIDLAIDIFVLPNVSSFDERKAYRNELKRAFKKDAVFLLSVFDLEDEYIKNCEPVLKKDPRNPTVCFDKEMNLERIAYTLDELVHEMSDTFELNMHWQRVEKNSVHGKNFLRKNHSTLWKLKS